MPNWLSRLRIVAPRTGQMDPVSSADEVLRSTHHPLRGVVLCVSALLLLACMDTTVKYLSARYPVPRIVALRYAVHCLLMLAIFAPRRVDLLIKTRRTALVVARSAVLAMASLLVGLALQRMPVAETSAIIFLAPMLVVLLAGPLLGERIGAVRWAASLTGLMGVLMIVRPGSGLDLGGVMFALGGVGALAAYQLLSRVLVRTEGTVAMLFYSALLGAAVFLPLLPWYGGGALPDGADGLLFVGVGVASAGGHFLFTAAYRHAPASLLAPMNYVQLLWAGLLGWQVFGHIPDALALLGMAIIAVSGVVVAFRPGKH